MVEEFCEGDCDLRSVMDEAYDTTSRLSGLKVGVDTVFMWGCGPAGSQWNNLRLQSSCLKCQGLRCGAGLPSAWLGLPAIGGVAISKN